MMMKKLLVLVAVVISLLFNGYLPAADPPNTGSPQTTCPVMGGKIDKEVYTDYQGQRIYFCCTGCVADFKKDPEKYMKKLKEQGVLPEKSPAAQ